jgi:hypothetical protein
VIVPVWFLYIGGFSLIILGVMQIQARPRKKDDGFYARFINVGTLWSLCCITVGTGLLVMALGWWTPEFARPPAARGRVQPRSDHK